MSDWLEQLSELEQRATKGKWYVVGAPWGDGTIVIAGNPDPHVGEYICDTDDALVMDDEQAKEHGSCNSIADAEFIAALRNNASELISRARRAEELERERDEALQRERAREYEARWWKDAWFKAHSEPPRLRKGLSNSSDNPMPSGDS